MKKSIPLSLAADEIFGGHGSFAQVSLKTVNSLRESGHDIVHLREQGLHRLPDAEILAKALREDRIVLTFDLDFGELLAAGGSTLPSAIIFRLRNQTAESVTPRLEQVVEEESAQLSAGAVVIVEESRYRVRRLPLT